MAEVETFGLIEEIESLVSDKLQMVSYKWLSRNYMLSSNAAKRLLQEFVQKHGNGLEVIYTLAGWLKSSPPSYHIKLVTGPKLAEAQQEYDGNCSVQVYSVQASIPKDPAALWNVEYIQAEELFKQPLSVDNCLRDNRFCGVSNSSVRRLVDGTSVVTASLQTKTAGCLGQTESNTVHQHSALPQPQQNKVPESIPKASAQSPGVVKDVNTENNGTRDKVVRDQPACKPSADKKTVLPLPTGRKKVQADKSSSASGGSLANLWGRASAKSKPSSHLAENSNTVSNSAEVQICAREAEEAGSSDDDSENVNFRASNSDRSRKRRVVFDFSDEDEYEDAINLSSPDVPNKQAAQDLKQNDEKLSEKTTLNLGMKTENKSKVKEERTTNAEANQPRREDFSVISKCTSTGKSSTEKPQTQAPEIHVNKKDNTNNAAPGSPKRRKVLKTRIDERGREVTEVVWEGEETEAKKADNTTTKKVDSSAITDTVNRALAPKKSSATTNSTSNPTTKGGKKAGNKDPKQGNILSFFKRA
ncbi:hypothetical protein L6164_018330 [Bauhinia variegata]|uniref:Uncharacterized protein n=1 Tax=Bauhinia variegata TaxID=167791 RepID=A0ACB9NAQ7_BAUVA|nr:hypothetical protein L6164_018330 [Bauhinia variegata]